MVKMLSAARVARTVFLLSSRTRGRLPVCQRITQPSLLLRVTMTTVDKEPEDGMHTPVDVDQPPIPTYKPRFGESMAEMRARLVYQSRKRGMLENGLLLSTFAHKFLEKMTLDQLKMYDLLINKPSNDWDIYHWIVGREPTPPEYDHEVMHMLQEHAQNKDKEVRSRQPDLH